MRVSVITATVGTPLLPQAVESVLSQTHADLDYTVVVDGPQWRSQAETVLATFSDPRLSVVHLPHATGERHNGHRIYGAFTFLVPGELILFLDEDNWFAPDHVAQLVDVVACTNSDWVYALRRIHTRDGQEVCLDDCESLGMWPSVLGEGQDHLVDVSCYGIKRIAALHMANLWEKEKYTGIDRTLYGFLSRHHPAFACTGAYSVHYRADAPAEGSVSAEFFLKGNQVMASRYPDGFPWAAQVTRHSDLRSA